MIKKEWTTELRTLFSSDGADSSKMEITPFRDWMVIIAVFFGGLAVSVGANIYMSVEINKDSFFTTAPKGGESVTLNKEGLSNVLSGLAEKEFLFEKARTEKSTVVDPSL